MRLSQVLMVAAAFLFTSEAIAVTVVSNQAKISTVASAGPNQRLLRSYKPVEEDSDDLDALDKTEERGRPSKLQALASSWGLSFDDIVAGTQRLTDEQQTAWIAIVNNHREKPEKKP
ncbi:Avirulence (Avh) protein [Phytophthora megakarya]|uniref:RxLR effector protein n=1 Tax=Phytophthora megakarya TaxID=4795 RepID=A0A225W184_9STRA|nr:Avirulence (Avh) protein [Phytophthora megakarya]